MIEDLEFASRDWSGMWRRIRWVILIPAALGSLMGFLLSYAFTAKYTAHSLILVEKQKPPNGDAQPVVPEDLAQLIPNLQKLLSESRLKPIVKETGLATGNNVEQVVDEIRRKARIYPVLTYLSQNETGGTENSTKRSDVTGLYVEYTGSNPNDAQLVCNELTLLLLEQNLNSRQQLSESLDESLHQVDEAKRNLDEQDAKLASFKKQHIGQFPTDGEKNMSALTDLNAQLNVVSQRISLARQSKSSAESFLTQQQVEKRKPAQIAASTATLEKQLSDLQSQLLQLQAQYADDHPDVVKTKADMVEVEKKLQEVNALQGRMLAQMPGQNADEPSEIRQLRSQVEHYDEVIAESTLEQKRIQQQIKIYQARALSSPSVEKQYKQLTVDHDTAQKIYADLLAKKSALENQTDLNAFQQSERIRMLHPANLPDRPSFPNRLLFAIAGWLGLALAFRLALWFEVRPRRFPWSISADRAYGADRKC